MKIARTISILIVCIGVSCQAQTNIGLLGTPQSGIRPLDPAPASTKQWEYLAARRCSLSNAACFFGPEEALKLVSLNELGKVGWELVSVQREGNETFFTFKRPLP